MGQNPGILKRFTRKRPVHTMTHESGGMEVTYDILPLTDDAIMDSLKNRAFLATEKPKYINFEKDIKRGRYEFYENDTRAGATVARVPIDDDSPSVTREITIFGQSVKVEESRVIHKLITAADDAYNLLDNNWLMDLFNIKPQMWQLIVSFVFGVAFGYMLAKSF